MHIPPAEPLPVFGDKEKREIQRTVRRYERLRLAAKSDERLFRIDREHAEASRLAEEARFKKDALDS